MQSLSWNSINLHARRARRAWLNDLRYLKSISLTFVSFSHNHQRALLLSSSSPHQTILIICIRSSQRLADDLRTLMVMGGEGLDNRFAPRPLYHVQWYFSDKPEHFFLSLSLRSWNLHSLSSLLELASLDTSQSFVFDSAIPPATLHLFPGHGERSWAKELACGSLVPIFDHMHCAQY